MDSVIKVRRSFLNEVRGLLNAFRAPCYTCYRSPCDCAFSEEMRRAKKMIVDIDRIRNADEERFYVENPWEEFLRKVETAVAQGRGRPVRSSEIHIKGASRQRKSYALKTLVKRRRIVRTTTDGEPIYVLAHEDGKHNNNTTKQG